jgi:hypothetical protein
VPGTGSSELVSSSEFLGVVEPTAEEPEDPEEPEEPL